MAGFSNPYVRDPGVVAKNHICQLFVLKFLAIIIHLDNKLKIQIFYKSNTIG